MSGNGTNARPKRGRPSGKNRVPLSAKERRARNALYERERRKGMEHELTELAKVVGCDREVTPDSKMLRMAFQIIKRSKDLKTDATKEELEEQNRKLENEIAKLEEEIEIGKIEDWLLQPS